MAPAPFALLAWVGRAHYEVGQFVDLGQARQNCILAGVEGDFSRRRQFPPQGLTPPAHPWRGPSGASIRWRDFLSAH
jgi:hypothetical protein